jgi:hypothetical protein
VARSSLLSHHDHAGSNHFGARNLYPESAGKILEKHELQTTFKIH